MKVYERRSYTIYSPNCKGHKKSFPVLHVKVLNQLLKIIIISNEDLFNLIFLRKGYWRCWDILVQNKFYLFLCLSVFLLVKKECDKIFFFSWYKKSERERKCYVKSISINFTVKQYFFTLRHVTQVKHAAFCIKSQYINSSQWGNGCALFTLDSFCAQKKSRKNTVTVWVLRQGHQFERKGEKKNLLVCTYMSLQYYFQKMHASKSGTSQENGKPWISNYKLRQMKNLKFILISTYGNIWG